MADFRGFELSSWYKCRFLEAISTNLPLNFAIPCANALAAQPAAAVFDHGAHTVLSVSNNCHCNVRLHLCKVLVMLQRHIPATLYHYQRDECQDHSQKYLITYGITALSLYSRNQSALRTTNSTAGILTA